jgi:stage IV sporulation protein FB
MELEGRVVKVVPEKEIVDRYLTEPDPNRAVIELFR